MKFNGTYEFNYNKVQVWKNLNDVKVLKECIDGCKEFTSISDNKYNAKIFVRLGPVNASFQSTIEIKNIVKEETYEIEASGNAGQLGYASGKIKVFLEEKNNKTLLKYLAETKINGKLAQLGSRLLEGSVKKNTDIFFNNFKSILNNNLEFQDNNKDKETAKNFISKYIIYLVLFIIFILLMVSLYGK